MNSSLPNGPIRIAIIGCGIIADTHVEAILDALPEAEISVADPLAGKAEMLRRKYKLRHSFLDIAEMLSETRPFAVHVVSPPHWHVRHARQSIEAGAHVFVEKPLCFDAQEASELYAFARAAGKTISVDHSLLFQPSVLRMKQFLAREGEARPLHVDSFYGLDAMEGDTATVPLGHWKRGMPGGPLMDSLVHPVSLAVGFTEEPSEPAVVTSSPRGDDQLKVMWKAGGTLVSITVSQGAQPFRRSTSFVFPHSTFIVDHSTEVLTRLDPGFGPRPLKKIHTNLGQAWQIAGGTFASAFKVARRQIQSNPGARALIAAFYQHLAGQSPNPVPEEAVLGTTSVLQNVAHRLQPEAPAPSLETRVEPALRDTASSEATQKVFVSGASGFLGRHVCARLIEAGNWRIEAQVRRGPNAARIPVAPQLTHRYADFDYASPVELRFLLDGTSAVVHCAHAAGAKTWPDYERRNVGHSLALYEAAAQAGCPRFVHISSLAVYGVASRADQPLAETAPLSHGKSSWDFYIRSKTMAEEALIARSRKGGPALLVLRLGILYSPRGERLRARWIPFKGSRLYITIGNGTNHLPYTRVDCVANLIAQVLMAKPFPTGVFNISGAATETMKDFTVARSGADPATARYLHVPALPLRVAAWALETLYSVLRRPSPPKLTRYIVDSFTRDLSYDTSKAEQVLGWDPAEAVRR